MSDTEQLTRTRTSARFIKTNKAEPLHAETKGSPTLNSSGYGETGKRAWLSPRLIGKSVVRSYRSAGSNPAAPT